MATKTEELSFYILTELILNFKTEAIYFSIKRNYIILLVQFSLTIKNLVSKLSFAESEMYTRNFKD